MIRLLLILFLLAPAARAEQVVLGLSQDEVDITANFDGSSLLIFGAVKRDAPIPKGAPLQVVITVAGPTEPVDIWRKVRTMGIWVNSDRVQLKRIPSFYAVASTAPLSEILSDSTDAQYRISPARALQSPETKGTVTDIVPFTDALLRIRTREQLFQINEGQAVIDQETLFRTTLALPSNLVEGNYAARIFLIRNGAVVDFTQTRIPVNKVGLERWLYTLAQDQPLAYAILSLVIAIAAGWLASASFRIFNR